MNTEKHAELDVARLRVRSAQGLWWKAQAEFDLAQARMTAARSELAQARAALVTIGADIDH